MLVGRNFDVESCHLVTKLLKDYIDLIRVKVVDPEKRRRECEDDMLAALC